MSSQTEPGSIQRVEYPEIFAQLTVEICLGANRELCILSPRLDHQVFDNPQLAEAVAALARRSRQTGIRILINDSRALVQRGHRLLTLARRLPSKVKLQKIIEHPQWNEQTIVIGDRDTVLHQSTDDVQNGFYEPGSPSSARQYLELFEDLWRYSVQDTELRSLRI